MNSELSCDKKKSRAEALSLPLDVEIKSMIEDTKQMGKLKFFPVIFDLKSDELLGQVYTLIDFRKKLK